MAQENGPGGKQAQAILELAMKGLRQWSRCMFPRASKELLFGAVLLTGLWVVNNAETTGTGPVQVGDTDLCVPQQYVAKLPTATPDSNYDTSEGFALDFIIQEEKVAEAIPGYQAKIAVPGQSERSQPLYVELAPREEKSSSTETSENFKSLEFAPDLVLVDLDKKPWELRTALAKRDGKFEEWGFCSEMSQGREDVLQCMREGLELGGVEMAYEVHQANLALHNELDSFLEKKTREWRCR